MINLRVAIETIESSLYWELFPKNPFVIRLFCFILLILAVLAMTLAGPLIVGRMLAIPQVSSPRKGHELSKIVLVDYEKPGKKLPENK
jgi:hypothetical protein